jgi:hypothetical protein
VRFEEGADTLQVFSGNNTDHALTSSAMAWNLRTA